MVKQSKSSGASSFDASPIKNPDEYDLNKTLTRLHFYLERSYMRNWHSIIIEPDMPVILGKEAQNTRLCLLSARITKEDVRRSLQARRMDSEDHHHARRLPTKGVLPPCTKPMPRADEIFPLARRVRKTMQDGLPREDYLPVEDFFRFRIRRWFQQLRSCPPTRVSRNRNFLKWWVVTYDYRRPLTLRHEQYGADTPKITRTVER